MKVIKKLIVILLTLVLCISATSTSYAAENGLAFSTEVTADVWIKSVTGTYNWNAFTTGIQQAFPFYTSQIIPGPIIYDYTVVGNRYPSNTQIRCTSSGNILCIGGEGTFTKTALVTVP